MKTLATIALALSMLVTSAQADTKAPVKAATAEQTIAAADAQLKTLRSQVKKATAAKKRARAILAAKKAQKALTKAQARAVRAQRKLEQSEEYQTCIDERVGGKDGGIDEDEAADICHAELDGVE